MIECLNYLTDECFSDHSREDWIDSNRQELYYPDVSNIQLHHQYYYYYYYYFGIPQQRESFSLIEGVSTDRYKSVEAQLLCM